MTAPKVVLVEDNPGDVELVRLAIADCCKDDDLVVFGDADSAIGFTQCADLSAGALFVLDLNLPKRSGFDVLETLHTRARELSHVDAIVLSSSSRSSERARALALGARQFISKPASMDELLTVGTRLCEALRSLGGRVG